MATSKFEPVDARKAFPCFDEPNLKSTYTTTLVHKPDYTPLSNMPVEVCVCILICEYNKAIPQKQR